jgi:four helix bundle protein
MSLRSLIEKNRTTFFHLGSTYASIIHIKQLIMDAQKVFDLSMECSQKIWDRVMEWKYFEKDTIGKQLVRSADSVSANLIEGAGRYHFKDRNLFSIYSRGSLFETHCWLEKAKNRGLITKPQFDELKMDYDLLHLEINKMIQNTRRQILK